MNRLTSVTYNFGSTGVAATASLGFSYGSSPSQYNNGLLITMTVGVGSENYSFDNLGRGNNGQITGITDSVDSGRSASYSFDALGRLLNAATSGATNFPAWGLGWSYDRDGNRTAQSISSGCQSPMTCPTNSVTIDPTTNRISGSGTSYDANGNMTSDGVNALACDAENHLISSSGIGGSATYSFDGNGLRVKKAVSGGTSTVYIFSGAQVIAEYENGAAPGSPTREYISSGSAAIAKIEDTSTTYSLRDHLSNRVLTDSTGNVVAQSGHFPYGESWYTIGTSTKWVFTSYERDADSGNDYAQARAYINRLGRFNSKVDPNGSATSAMTGSLTAATFWTTTSTGPSGWNGGNYTPYVGPAFLGMTFPQMETNLIHEMRHPALNQSGNAKAPAPIDNPTRQDYDLIVKSCSTGIINTMPF